PTPENLFAVSDLIYNCRKRVLVSNCLLYTALMTKDVSFSLSVRGQYRGRRKPLHWIVSFLFFSACAYPVKKDSELATLLQAFQQQNAQVAEQRRQRQLQGIKKIEVLLKDAAEAPLVSVDLEDAILPLVVHSVLDQAAASFLL